MANLGDPGKSHSDIDLMLNVRGGDQDAFASLYGRYHRRVLDFFFALSRNAQTAEDLCQETFFRIWGVRRRYAATGSFPAYVFSFARNIWLEECRRFKKNSRLGVREVADEATLPVSTDARGQPDALAGRTEIEERVFAALERLPEEQRMTFVLRLQGLSVEEISRMLDCPPNTVRSRKILAIRKLRQALQGLFVL